MCIILSVLRLFLSLNRIYNNPTHFILQDFFKNKDFSLEIWYNILGLPTKIKIRRRVIFMRMKKNDEDSTLSHTKWNCSYHIVFAPKYRRKAIYGKLRGEIL